MNCAIFLFTTVHCTANHNYNAATMNNPILPNSAGTKEILEASVGGAVVSGDRVSWFHSCYVLVRVTALTHFYQQHFSSRSTPPKFMLHNFHCRMLFLHLLFLPLPRITPLCPMNNLNFTLSACSIINSVILIYSGIMSMSTPKKRTS